MKMLIGGEKRDASDGKTIDVVNPATGEFIDTVPAASQEDVNEAVRRARNGQKEWGAKSLLEKETVLNRFLELLETNKREIMLLLAKEQGKSPFVSLFEYNQTVPIFRGYFEQARRLDGKLLVPGTEPGHDARTKDDMIMVVQEPIGTVAGIVPFNAPMLLLAYKAAPALAAGNAFIGKLPSDNPLGALRMSELLIEAGMPGDAFQILTGSGATVGSWLVEHPGVDAIAMTGSTEVGLEIAQKGAKRLAHVALELGGNDAFIVLEDANIEQAAAEGVFTRMATAGQVCIAPKRFLVQNPVKEKFTGLVLGHMRGVKMGFEPDLEGTLEKLLGSDAAADSPNVMMGCLINETAAKKVESQVALTVSQGAKVLLGGGRNGAFYEPTVLVDVTKEMDVAKDLEIFGPVIPIIGFDTAEEALEIANSGIYGLSGCVYTADWKKGMDIARRAETGCMVINGTTMYRNAMQPFGGYKMSGLGNEGFTTLSEMTRTKTIVMKGFYDTSI
ncbi:MAG: aldehyde dehydrogenase family protein [Clostridiales Family XIII bacterium]|jgi:succinate-semialdehyde dehydrogenase/glutarate-semialdehyde dehydrogenase|nr:aldehyde dehydrogenase family protein [Clostridiales Family XIII bacterium]